MISVLAVPRRRESSDYENYMRAAANYIQSRHFKEALNVLNSMEERNALWYYYSAVANNGLGNNVLALQYAKQAAAMEPGNRNYAQLVQVLEGGGTWYRGRQESYGYPDGGSDLCLKLCMANMLCNCCCGGRIFWC